MHHEHTLEALAANEILPSDDTGRPRDAEGLVKPMSSVSRRRFLFAGAGAAALVGAGASGAAAQPKPAPARPKAAPRPVAATAARVPFMQPRTLAADAGKLHVSLDVMWASWPFSCTGTPPTDQVPTYNGQVMGPTVYARPGDRVHFTLSNKLITNPFTGDTCHAGMQKDPPLPGCFTHTNLHTHGLLVSPSSALKTGLSHCIGTGPCGPIDSAQVECASDDVLVDVAAGDSVLYQIDIPAFHEPGTFWYHSHLHGASGYQVSSGMAGALIIKEPAGKEIVPPERESVFLMQEIVSGKTKTGMPAVYGNLAGGDGPPKTFFYINGQCQPTVQLSAGRLYRWRFINATATPQGLMKLRLIQCSTDPKSPGTCPAPSTTLRQPAPAGDPIPMDLIAVDGLSFYGFPPQPVKAHLMAPGNRADFLIKLPAGRYVLYKDASPQDATCIDSTTPVAASFNTTQVLAFIIVDPSTSNDAPITTIAGTPPFYREPITRGYTERPPVSFTSPQFSQQFKINNTYYQPDQIMIQAKLNTAEEWTIDNSNGGNTHPFHIHVNPFQVVGRTIDFETATPSLDPKNPANWMWMDTVALPMPITGSPVCSAVSQQNSAQGQLKLRTRYLVYPGQYVIHCHILIHEDVGMMANVKIDDDGSGIGPCVPRSEPTAEAIACVKRTSGS